MNRNLNRKEQKLLLYFYLVAFGCRNYIKSCGYTPYTCGYSESTERTINTYELCLFEAGVIHCPGEIETHYRETHNKSTYRSILRNIDSLERKGYIERDIHGDTPDKSNGKWLRSYRLNKHKDIYHPGLLFLASSGSV